MNIKWVVCFYWEQIVQPPRTSHYKLQLCDFFFLCSFIQRQSCLIVWPLKAAQLSHTGGISSLSQPRVHVIRLWFLQGADGETQTVFVTSRKKEWHQMTSGCVLCSPCSFIMALHYKASVLNHPIHFLHHPSRPEWAHNAAHQMAFDIQLAHLQQWPAHEGRHMIEKWLVMSVAL